MMRITSGMMMNTTKLNINNNKVSVDRLNTQMSTQKKIVKPSDNPLIAIKSLRLSTTLSQINQYYNNNIKDAQSWMDVTETAMTNMKDVLQDAYRLCVNGSTDTLTDEDRNTILTQLKGLSNQLYSEANADYADRTVFSGYKTNSNVTFSDAFEASQANYDITEQLSASDIESYAYYANKLDTPTAEKITATTKDPVGTPEEELLKRLRLAYSKQTSLKGFSYNYSVDTTSGTETGTTTGNVTIKDVLVADPADPTKEIHQQTFQWRSLRKDSAFTYEADATGKMSGASLEDLNGYVLDISSDGKFSVNDPSLTYTTRETTIAGTTTKHYTYTDKTGNVIFTAAESVDANGVKTAFVADSQGNVVRMSYTGTQTGGTGTPGDPFQYTGPYTLSEITDPQGNTMGTNLDKGAGSNDIVVNKAEKKADGTDDPVLTATPAADGTTYKLTTADKNLTTEMKVETMKRTDFEQHLKNLAEENPATIRDDYKDTLIYLPDSGELVFGSNLAQMMTSEYATLNVDYEKDGFLKGETRPEMYFNCTNKSDKANPITYTNYDADNNWIYQNIDYAVSANQDIAINTQIHDVVSADCYRDLAELTDIVQASIDAHTTVSDIEKMISSTDYPSEDEQKYLQDCLEKAKKQMAYADDHLQKVFGSQISHFEKYMSKVNLAITDIGTRGDQLSLAENRMSNQKTTFTELKSNNEDEELSDVTIDYTSAYTAYQASLQAAGKIDDMSLLDYL